jgi:glycosyltransferase involved in cell wall biosynthesis
MPIKLFEYITFGLPVITSDFGHLKSVTEINQTGLIISPNDKSSICDAMENLLVNNKLYNDLVLNCINEAPKYHWSIMEKRLLYLYQSITFKHQQF